MTTRRRLAALARATLALTTMTTIGLGLLFAGQASADVSYNPPAGTGNGVLVYLSQACHDGNDGVPGGPCIPNPGCDNYNENDQSAVIARAAAVGGSTGANLIERGFRVRVGTGTVSQNIANSNAAGARMHIPLHTNARSEACTNTTASGHGTWVLYVSTNGGRCASIMTTRVGAVSPGTNDQRMYRDNLGELNNTNAVACYLEAEFHTWNQGVSWIRAEDQWSWRLGATVDEYFGYP